jgi:hypothetical protein
MRYPELEGYICLGWSDDLKPWGIILSCWYRPRTGDFAWLYKRKGQYHVAKTYKEQVAIHRRYGIPVVPPGSWFKSHGQPEQLALF